MTNETSLEIYRGTLTLPGDDEPREVGLRLNMMDKSVRVQFQDPVAGAVEWLGSGVKVAKRLKYLEVQFTTEDLPVKTVELVWKFNASFQDDTLAGVVIARPNDLKVKGEKGFVLAKGS